MVKVDLISGFLGAGKTTLIKKLFQSSLKNEQVVIIENEFGEIGIDGSFLKDSGVQIKEINSGCICCSLVGDFASSMKEVISKFNPNRIIIEPSGVGKLSDIIRAIGTVDEDLSLNIVCCVVDAKKVKLQLRNFGEFLHNQIEYAKTIVVSKVDMVDEDKLQESVDLVKEINDKANVISTNIEELDADNLLKVLEESNSLKDMMINEIEEEHECCHGHHHHDDEDEEHECCHGHHHHDEENEEHECCHGHHHHDDEDEEHECCHGHHHHDDEDEEHECCHGHHHHDDEDEEHECCHGHHHHHHGHDADEVFTSWGMETVKSISKEKLIEFLDFLKSDNNIGIILRSKGILKSKDGAKWLYFDYVDGDYEIREGNPDYTGRIVVIGSKINEHLIAEKFEEKAN